MNKNYEEHLPDGYIEAKVIDAKSKKFGIIMNIAALIPLIISVVIAYSLFDLSNLQPSELLLSYSIFMLSIISYVILHELTHGIVYKLMTKHKLKFGLSLTCAYCGVPDIYVYRRPALIAVLSPFVLFTIIITAVIFIVPGDANKFMFLVLDGLHIGGCFGDLYVTYTFLTKFKDPATLTNDTGPKQTFYTKQ